MTPDDICVLDNGAYTAKVGLSTSKHPKSVLNCVTKAKSERRRAFIGNQIDECRDASGLFYILGFQKGYLLNWDVQKTVWDYMFSADCTGISLAEKTLVITEPQFNFASIQEATCEIFFEEYDCDALLRTTAADLCAYNYSREKKLNSINCLVIDLGYSFSHIVPFVAGKKITQAVRRIDIGGKVLTNYLKELISYRDLNVMDESYVVNQIKEDVCFVSQDFNQDMKTASNRSVTNPLLNEYVLPDFTSVRRGYVKKQGEVIKDQQTVKLLNERFTIPELFFHPMDVGINQMGIPEAVMDCVKSCPTYAYGALLSNIIVVGGSALFPGMATRLQNEIRSLASDDIEVRVEIPDEPTLYAWHGGKQLSSNPQLPEHILTKEAYDENGFQPEMGQLDLEMF